MSSGQLIGDGVGAGAAAFAHTARKHGRCQFTDVDGNELGIHVTTLS